MNNSEKTNNTISILHSPTNYKNLIFSGVSFKQIALIVYKDHPHYILSPLLNLEGKSDNLAIVYTIQEDNNNLLMAVPESIQCAVFKKYYTIYSKQQKGEIGVDGSILKSEILYDSFMLFGDKRLEALKKRALATKKYLDYQRITELLRTHVKGQDATIERVAKLVLEDEQMDGPVVITLLGAGGTGKTTLAQRLAQGLCRDVVLLQGSMYSDENAAAAQRLTGFDPNYKAANLGKVLKEKLDSGKLAFVIDEPDQFANDVRSIMFPWFSEGTTTDAFLGVTVSVKDVIFIICANCCQSIYENGGMMADVPLEKIAEELSKEIDAKGRRLFPDPLLSRMISCGSILIYNNLSSTAKQEIIRGEVKKKVEMHSQNDIEYHFDYERLSSLLLYNRPRFDARQLKGEVKKFFNEIKSACDSIVVEENVGYIDRINIDIVDYESELSSITDTTKHKLLFFGDPSDSRKLSANIALGDENFDSHFTRGSEIEAILIDATNSIEDARRIFLEVKDRNINNLPIHLYSKQKISRSKLTKFIEEGATDVYTPTCDISLDEWFHKVVHGLEIEAACRALDNRGMHIGYYIDYEAKKHTLNVNITPRLSDDVSRYAEGKRVCMEESDLKRVAIHEASHAVAAYCLNKTAPDSISVISRGSTAGNVTYFDNHTMMTESMLRDRICIALAGRVAEKLFYDEEVGTNTGAASDIRVATNIATDMITKFGMAGSISVSDKVDRTQIEAILNTEYKRTEELVSKNRDIITQVADSLLEKRYLSKKDFERIIISNVG